MTFSIDLEIGSDVELTKLFLGLEYPASDHTVKFASRSSYQQARTKKRSIEGDALVYAFICALM